MEISEEIYDHLLNEINEQDISLFDGLLYEAKDPKVFLEKSKLLPFGKRILKITRDRPFKESVVNLVEGKVKIRENFSIEDTVKNEIETYGHNYLEKVPANWKEMNPYIAERMKEKDKIPSNVDRGIYGGVYDLLDIVQSLQENNLNSESLQTLYNIGKRFKETENIKSEVKKENNVDEFQQILEKSLQSKRRFSVKEDLNGIFGNYVFGMLKLKKERFKSEKETFEMINPVPERIHIDIHSILVFFEKISKYKYKEYIKKLSKHVWDNYIENLFEKKRIIFAKESLKKELKDDEKEKLIFQNLLDIIEYLPQKLFSQQRRVIKSIFFYNNYPFVNIVYKYIKEMYINREWKEINGEKMKKLILGALNLIEIDANFELDVFESIFPSPFLQNSRNKIREVDIAKPFIDREYISKFIQDPTIYQDLLLYQRKNKMETLTINHITSFLFEYKMSHSFLLKNGSILRLMILPRKELFQMIQNIRKNSMIEFSKIFDRSQDLNIHQIYSEFHQFIKVNHPHYFLYFIAWNKRILLDCKSRFLSFQHQIYYLSIKSLKDQTYFYKLWKKYFE